MKAALPHSTAPSGAPRPLVKSTQTEVAVHDHFGGGDAGGHHGVHQPSAVHVGGHAEAVGHVRRGVQLVLWPDRAAAEVGSLLDLHQGLRRGIAALFAEGGA